MAKLYRGPSKPIDIYKKTGAVQKKKSPEALANIQKKQHQRLGNYARLRAKIEHLNNMIKQREPKQVASLIRYWVKYQ